ncbi:DUF3095 domain-containing protein [Aquibium carbonis]|uniref:DUF3095 domain-containing protein n=1 Tax=Aquibium carbonis TaxID=2495581 RepID=A0A3R9ZTJ3_9HYPH|nr:DUF3095 domain-containing protein [Aquibium carbonis]RST87370.1 DUF3095 domain-containing protein [Aquibium carbonis]
MADPLANDFYARLAPQGEFSRLADGNAYVPLPDDWYVGTADIVGSTAHIAAGRYKIVNTVGASVISAQMNAADGMTFPFVFGGDGASFAFPSGHLPRATDALSRVLRWAADAFGFELRGAIVPVADIRAAGFDVSVARYRPSATIDYAMFAGGGLAWADREMKAGRYRIDPAPEGALPDLSGLSCRWTPMKSRNGTILSVLVLPRPGADPAAVTAVSRRVVEMTRGLAGGGHPVPPEGPGVTWPNEGIAIEALASRGHGSLLRRKIELLATTLVAHFFFITRIKLGAFDPTHYVQVTRDNADFRKFDDGLKMTIDCDAATRDRIETVLREASAAGIVSYGLFEQESAIMTCIVPSVTSDNHVHFIDGAAGGYTSAAMALRAAP